MKITNVEVLIAGDALTKVVDMKLPLRVSRDVIRLKAKLRPIIEEVSAMRDGLLKRFGEQEKNSPRITINEDSPKWEKFLTEWMPLAEEEIELKHTIITLPIKVDGEPLTLEPTTLEALEKFIDIE